MSDRVTNILEMHVCYVYIYIYISGKFVILIWQFAEFFFNRQTTNAILRGRCGSTYVSLAILAELNVCLKLPNLNVCQMYH